MNINKGDYIDGDKFENISDFSFGDKYTVEKKIDIKELSNFFNNYSNNILPIIYCDSDRVFELFKLINEYGFTKEFALLSHNGDTTFNTSNRPRCVKKWFAQNMNCSNNDNVLTLPIGLERKLWSKKRYDSEIYKNCKLDIQSSEEYIKNKLLYLNFNVNTNILKRGKLYNMFNKNEWCFINNGGLCGDIDKYYREIGESKYVLCPDGNGIDCHRTWEVLYMGSIPVIEKSKNHINLYSDLPVLIVDSYKDINEEFLLNVQFKSMDKYKLSFDYWENKISKMLKK